MLSDGYDAPGVGEGKKGSCLFGNFLVLSVKFGLSLFPFLLLLLLFLA